MKKILRNIGGVIVVLLTLLGIFIGYILMVVFWGIPNVLLGMVNWCIQKLINRIKHSSIYEEGPPFETHLDSYSDLNNHESGISSNMEE